ncbi:hypothetical protein [Archaeoglobus profundus]|uniref:Uncharacterized protein n=1 Tax=Archaeoglobus profundus (strain DSM 5631 / JCM 9629 / NBRC 100127 / Av18) TaxID=572546 RepID=D2RH58_ARCPA|nr:hypothetical protein [Archaeoglobus profundus]ADB57633.1 hypothetical protein Arcpr_0568 [Archaeoglobus profundus DSM 5631]
MARVGVYRYPDISLKEAVSDLDKIKRFLGKKVDGEITREAIAKALGLTPRGGRFTNKIASLIHYGFLESAGDGKVKLTELAKEILYPIGNSDIEAMKKAFFSIQLFKDLYEQYGDSVTVEQIEWFLRAKANADPREAKEKARKIHKIYIEGLTQIFSVEKQEEQISEEILDRGEEIMMEREVLKQPEGIEEIKFGDVRIWLPPTEEGVKIAEQLIKLFKETRLKVKEVKEEEKEE